MKGLNVDVKGGGHEIDHPLDGRLMWFHIVRIAGVPLTESQDPLGPTCSRLPRRQRHVPYTTRPERTHERYPRLLEP